MNKKYILFFLCSVFFVQLSFSKVNFSKVILWGHKMYSHTHSFIHYGFFKGFKSLGYEVYWLDKNDDISKIDFANSLFITEGQVDQNMPLRRDCFYVLHNCDLNNYKTLPTGNVVELQVYINDCENRGCYKLAPYVLYDFTGQIIYMPWATDLLPEEIEQFKDDIKKCSVDNSKNAVFIGTAGDGVFGNKHQISEFRSACERIDISFLCRSGSCEYIGDDFCPRGVSSIDNDDCIAYIKGSYLAPAIQGQWQCEVGYIPCRIFKNISYGKLGGTNNKTVYELFNQEIVYNPDCYQLCLDMHDRMQTITEEELFKQMDFVRDHHTYLNRIESILTVLNMVNSND